MIVAICNYRRNDALGVLLRAQTLRAEPVRERAAVGVDNTVGREARRVAQAFADAFEPSLGFRISGQQNILLARSLAVGKAMDRGDWGAMNADDCETPRAWPAELLGAQAASGADCVIGRVIRRAPARSNTMISGDWLPDCSSIRVDPAFCRRGGDDLVFLRAASRETVAPFCRQAASLREPIGRERDAWLPVIQSLQARQQRQPTAIQSGTPCWRRAVHDAGPLVRGPVRPVAQFLRGQTLQPRSRSAQMLRATGKSVAPLGVRVDHH